MFNKELPSLSFSLQFLAVYRFRDEHLPLMLESQNLSLLKMVAPQESQLLQIQNLGAARNLANQLKGKARISRHNNNRLPCNFIHSITFASLPRTSMSARTAALALGLLHSCSKLSYYTHKLARNH